MNRQEACESERRAGHKVNKAWELLSDTLAPLGFQERIRMSHAEAPQLNSPARGGNSTGQAEHTEKMTWVVLGQEITNVFCSVISVSLATEGERA